MVSQLQLLLFSGLAFFLMLGWLRRTETISLDVDWFWRHWPGLAAERSQGRATRPSPVQVIGALYERALRVVYRAHGPTGVLARSRPTGSMAFWATVLLGAFMLLYYLG
ncbi:MAG: hypothetical protein ACTSYE_10770 [Alphaproteobacteria bacterium]